MRALAIVIVLFIAAPVAAIEIPLPPGPGRDKLVEVCELYRTVKEDPEITLVECGKLFMNMGARVVNRRIQNEILRQALKASDDALEAALPTE